MFTLAVSTLAERIYQLESWTIPDDIPVLVLWQNAAQAPREPKLPAHFQIQKLDSLGVAKSRNAALERVVTPWLWFLDDDIQIAAPVFARLRKRLATTAPQHLLIASVLDPQGAALKTKPDQHLYARRDMMGVGTIQIICHADTVRRSGVRFPENMGAGSAYPACDEPVFLHRLHRAGLTIHHAATIEVSHPRVSSGQYLQQVGQRQARAMLFREVFGWPLCYPAALLFWWKHFAAIGWCARGLFDFSVKAA